MSSRPSIVYVTWSTSPTKGSEPGSTWSVLRLLLEVADVELVTRDMPQTDELDDWVSANPDAGLTVHRVAVPNERPRLMRRLHRASPRIYSFVIYRQWLHPARAATERLIAERAGTERPIELVWHCGLAAYWLGTTIGGVGVPTVLGPVYGDARAPTRLLPVLGLQGVVEDYVDRLAVWTAARKPSITKSLREVDVIIAGNEETADSIEKLTGTRPSISNTSLLVPPLPPPDGTEVRDDTVLWLGGLEYRKGPHLALRALARAPEHVRMRVVGSGPLEEQLHRLARELGVADRIEWRPFPKERAEVIRAFRTCGLAVFTGLKEEGGLALSDGLHAGAPLAVLDNGGAGYMARRAKHPETVALVRPGSVQDTAERLAAVMTSPPPAAPGSNIDLELFGGELQSVLHDLLGARQLS